MKHYYPSEKFSVAVRTLAVGTGTLQRRVADALFSISILLAPTHLEKLPQEKQEKLRELEAAQASVDDPEGQGTLNVWASHLPDNEAMDIAAWIVDTADLLDREYRSDESGT